MPIVFDVGFLPNRTGIQNYVNDGASEPVAQFYLHDEVNNFIYCIITLSGMDLPMLETKIIELSHRAIGCTGGKHRSVCIAQQIGEYFEAKGKDVKIQHKSPEKNKKLINHIKNAATCVFDKLSYTLKNLQANVRLTLLFSHGFMLPNLQ